MTITTPGAGTTVMVDLADLVGLFRRATVVAQTRSFLRAGAYTDARHVPVAAAQEAAACATRQVVADTLRTAGHADLVKALMRERSLRLSMRVALADEVGAQDGSDDLDETLGNLVAVRAEIATYVRAHS